MEITKILKAMADDTRFRILILLLQHNYCVRALSRKLELSESAISQHIKVLREAGLLIGVKKVIICTMMWTEAPYINSLLKLKNLLQ